VTLPQIPLDDPRVLALARARQQLAHDCTHVETWEELTEEDRRTALPVARNYLEAAINAGLIPQTAPAAPPGDLEARVRRAYRRLASEPQDWVMLTALRAALPDVPREVLDAELRRMVRMPGVVIAPEAYQARLTSADRAAALHIGGKDKHMISIER
jgi:hypothetical protein